MFINLSISISCPFASHSIPHTPACYIRCLCETSRSWPSLSPMLEFVEIDFPPIFCSYHIYFIDIHNSYIHTLYVDAYIYTYVNIHVCIYMPIFVIISQHWLSTYSVLCIVLGAPQTLILLLFSETLWIGRFPYPHFMEEKTDSGNLVTCLNAPVELRLELKVV